MADIADSSTLNGDDGVRFSREWINCDTTIVSASADEVLGMPKW